MVGLFINTVPVRVRCSADDSIAAVLARVRAQAVASQEHEHVSLADIQAVTPLGRRLLDHILIFENYPIDEALKAAQTAIARLKDSGASPEQAPSLYLTLGQIHDHRGDWDEALGTYQQGARLGERRRHDEGAGGVDLRRRE